MKREGLYVRSTLESDGFDLFISGLGGNPITLMQEAGLSTTPPKGKIHFASWAAMTRYFELAAMQLNEPYLGLKWAFAQPKDYRNSGPTLFLGNIASDMRQFLDLAISYQKIHTNGVKYSYEENADKNELTAVISIHPLSPPCRQFTEQIMAGMAIMGGRYIENFKLKRVTFQYSQPSDMHLYHEVFKCPIEFDADRHTVVLDCDYMDTKRQQLTTKIFIPAVKKYLNWKINNQPHAKQSLAITVAEILPAILGTRNSDVAMVAKQLNMHPKKLQRLLKDEQTSYSEVLDETRKNLADRLLAESNISIIRIATMLDYVSDRPFTLATKRWFGMTPTQYRKTLRLK